MVKGSEQHHEEHLDQHHEEQVKHHCEEHHEDGLALGGKLVWPAKNCGAPAAGWQQESAKTAREKLYLNVG